MTLSATHRLRETPPPRSYVPPPPSRRDTVEMDTEELKRLLEQERLKKESGDV